MERFVTSDE